MGNLIVVKNADFSQVAVEQVRMTPELIEWNNPSKYCAVPASNIIIGETVWDFENSLKNTTSGINCAIMECTSGDYFKVKGTGTIVPIAFVNNDNIVLSFIPSSISAENIVEAPAGATKVMIQSKVDAYKL